MPPRTLPPRLCVGQVVYVCVVVGSGEGGGRLLSQPKAPEAAAPTLGRRRQPAGQPRRGLGGLGAVVVRSIRQPAYLLLEPAKRRAVSRRLRVPGTAAKLGARPRGPTPDGKRRILDGHGARIGRPLTPS